VNQEGDLEKALAEATAQVAEHKDSLLRLQADMENLRRRTARDIENAHKYALEKFVSELLPIMDSFDMGKQSIPADLDGAEKIREGLDMTQNTFEQVLVKFGVEIVNPQAGEKFNPEAHNAVTMQPSAEHPSQSVIQVFQKGYSLNGRLVRPALVVVAQ
jgi:molecular chaperone GrpE